MTAVVPDVDRFCLREHPRLVASLALYTGDRDLAVELSQEALARACRDWAHVSTLEAPGAWVHRVAVNLANSHFRRRKYERAALARAAARTEDAVHPPAPPLADAVVRGLKALPARQREAVVLRFLLDLSVEQTADRMGCAQGTVRALTAQGVAALRRDPALADLQEPRHD